MRDNLKKILNNKKIMSYFVIFFISLFICIPLFSKHMDISRDDGIQHICRLMGTYDSVKEAKLFPVIMSQFCNGFGYSWNLFYSPLTAYIPLVFKIITNSFVMCLKLFMFVSIFLSGVYMFQFTYKVLRSYKAGVIAALLYMSAPYHLTDLYNRIAIAELASFMFLPLVFSGMYDLLYHKKKKPYEIIFGTIGLILSHNVITVYVAIFCGIYLCIHYKKLNNKNIIKKILICLILILLCTSFYWIPLLEHMMNTTYEVFIPQRMYKDNTLVGSKLTLLELLFAQKHGMYIHIGAFILLGLIFTCFYYKKAKNRTKQWLRIFMIFGMISAIMTLKIFPYEHMPNILKMIQFTWRMLEFSSFFLAFVASYGMMVFLKGNYKKEIYVVIAFMVYLAVSVLHQKIEVAIPFQEERYRDPIPVSAQTGRIHAGCASFEYLPKKAFSNRQYLETRTQEVYVLEGNAFIENFQKENLHLDYDIKTAENAKLELPYIYYLGYQANLLHEDGTKTQLKISESEKGFCMIEIPNIEKGRIIVDYNGTVLMKTSYLFSGIGWIMAIFYWRIEKFDIM